MGQHTVPQRYLSNFQDPDHPGFVWLHDKRGGSPRLAAIKSVLQQPQFYMPRPNDSSQRGLNSLPIR